MRRFLWKDPMRIISACLKKTFTNEPTVSVLKKYKDIEGVVKMEEVDGEELVKNFAEEMEEMLGRKMKSVKVTMTKNQTSPADRASINNQ